MTVYCSITFIGDCTGGNHYCLSGALVWLLDSSRRHHRRLWDTKSKHALSPAACSAARP